MVRPVEEWERQRRVMRLRDIRRVSPFIPMIIVVTLLKGSPNKFHRKNLSCKCIFHGDKSIYSTILIGLYRFLIGFHVSSEKPALLVGKLGLKKNCHFFWVGSLFAHETGNVPMFIDFEIRKERSLSRDTLFETNIAPENRPSRKKTSIPTIHFQVLC